MARLSLMQTHMRRTAGVLSLAVVAMICLFSTLGEAPAAGPLPRQPVEAPIRIQHDLVGIPPAAPRRPSVPPAARPRSARLPERESTRFVARARRVIFGDGTFRPQPFPRIR